MPYYILLVTVLKQNVKNNIEHLWLPHSYIIIYPFRYITFTSSDTNLHGRNNGNTEWEPKNINFVSCHNNIIITFQNTSSFSHNKLFAY